MKLDKLKFWCDKYLEERRKCFIELHHHDSYSLRGGLGTTKEALGIVKSYGWTHYCVTNYGEVTGWVNQYFNCRDNNIIPILGVEAYISNYRLLDEGKKVKHVSINGNNDWEKEIVKLNADERSLISSNYNLLMYAKNMEGYYNIIKCCNEAQLYGFAFGKPRMTEKFILNHAEGIMVIFPCFNGEIIDLLLEKREEEAIEKIRMYKKRFYDVYLELLIISNDKYRERNHLLINFAKKYNLSLIVSCNSHYLYPEDAKTFEILQYFSKGSKNTIDYEIDITDDMSLKDINMLYKLYEKYYSDEIFTKQILDECLCNIYNICQEFRLLELDMSPKLPSFNNSEQILRDKAWQGLEKRGLKGNKIYEDRLEYELDNIIRAGFADYFLLLEDIINWCHKVGNPVGPGRGSSAGCLVLYCLYVTQVNPIKYNLLFERFLDANRLDEIINKGGEVTGDMYPDVDVDVMDRDMVKQYIAEKYGENNICSIGTAIRMKNKSVLIEISRALGIDIHEIQAITTGEMKYYGVDEEEWDVELLEEKTPSLKLFFEKYPEVKKHFSKLKGNINHWGQHAGGILISDVSLLEQLPVRKVDNQIVSCWTEGLDDRELGKMGFIKMDLLAIKTLKQIQDTIDLIKKRYPQYKDMNMYDLPLEDSLAIKKCNELDNIGIFQMDSYVMPEVIKAMGGVNCFEDYAIASALMRPSALQAELHKKFGKRRNGDENYEIPEVLKNTMSATYGLTIFQESAYHIAKNLAGFSIVEAYKFMKLLYKGKMSKDKIPEWRDKFYKGCEKYINNKEVTKEYVENIFEDLLKFQGYGFCASHATSYAMLTAWQLYLKTHFFPEFMCCFLNRTDRASEDKKGMSLMEKRVNYIKKNGVKILRPSVNKSEIGFSIQDGGIRFGLSVIKGISSAAIEIINNRPYKDIEDFCNKVSNRIIHKSRFESLVFSGALDEFGDREYIYNWYFNQYRNKNDKKSGEQEFLFDIELDEKEEYVYFTDEELFSKEKEMLGVILYEDFFSDYNSIVKEYNIKRFDEILKKKSSPKVNWLLVRIENVSKLKSKKTSNDYILIDINDGLETLKLFMSNYLYEKLLGNKVFEKNNIVLLKAKKDNRNQGFIMEEKLIENIKVIGKMELKRKL